MASITTDPHEAYRLRVDSAGLDQDRVTVVAAAGTSASNATAITSTHNVVTGATGAAGVVLPAADTNRGPYEVVNDNRNYALLVYPVSGGDDKINEISEDTAFYLAPNRTAVFEATSATQWYCEHSASDPVRETSFEYFDDFLTATIGLTTAGSEMWITFAGTDANATALAINNVSPEGTADMGSGNADGTEDGSVMSLILLAKGSLISLGTTVFETRLSLSALTGCSMNAGLSDTLATTAERLLYTVNSGTVADGGLSLANAACFSFDFDATANTVWTICTENGGTIATTETTTGTTVTANTYATLRIEVDEDGDARFYVNGVLTNTVTTAVATTALLIPYIAIDSATDTQTDTDLDIDYVYFSGARAASQ
jgi:hypothetical protein